MNTETTILLMAGIAVLVFLSVLALISKAVFCMLQKKKSSKLMALPSGYEHCEWIKTAGMRNLCSVPAMDKGKSL